MRTCRARRELLAPLTRFGAWQRRHFVAQPGYLATAWEASGYHAGIGYDRDTPAAVCLGTPGYRYDPLTRVGGDTASRFQQNTQCCERHARLDRLHRTQEYL